MYQGALPKLFAGFCKALILLIKMRYAGGLAGCREGAETCMKYLRNASDMLQTCAIQGSLPLPAGSGRARHRQSTVLVAR
ncbi:hypothetical protein Pfl01_1263 [Pseudomonas fluorescens Pf0-1]|uniref:Uncharacterized protein n=1 Tax=Pseudomonas fluorescens (strain Pf0-1) TaxID=205922 RepID=Q3KGV0_PSEPF|nr:hypothetical protein Pfl01_1263 [Pseudomonas fluorescens Pf0-1]